MTIAIGFPFNKGIILASDSQVSYPLSNTLKQTDQKKIRSIKLPWKMNSNLAAVQDNAVVLMAFAGTISSADYFQEQFEIEISNLKYEPPNQRAIADLAEKAIKKTRSSVIHDVNENNQSIIDNGFEVIICYFHNDKPVMYKSSLWAGIFSPELVHSPFVALGCGQTVASSILSGFDFGNLESLDALWLACYVVEMCKENDTGCGGRTQFGYLINSTNIHANVAEKLMPSGAFHDPEIKSKLDEVASMMRTKLMQELRNKMPYYKSQ